MKNKIIHPKRLFNKIQEQKFVYHNLKPTKFYLTKCMAKQNLTNIIKLNVKFKPKNFNLEYLKPKIF